MIQLPRTAPATAAVAASSASSTATTVMHEHRGEADRFEQSEFSGPIEDPGADQGGQDEPDGEQQRDGEGAQHDRGGVVPLGCVGEATVTYL